MADEQFEHHGHLVTVNVWIAAEVKGQEGARQWLRTEVAENITLFDARVADWSLARASPAGSLVPRMCSVSNRR